MAEALADVPPNEVISVVYLDLIGVVERAAASEPRTPDSDDSIEVFVSGKRVRRAPSSDDSIQIISDKRARLSPAAESLPVLKLSLPLVAHATSPILPDHKAFTTLLAKHPYLQHPHILTPVSFTQKRTSSPNEAHRLTVTLPAQSNLGLLPLIYLNPFDATNALAWTWSQKGKHRVPSVGEGGLLDALVALRTRGVDLNASISVELDRPTGNTIFHLHLTVGLQTAFYATRHYDAAKHLVLDYLFPSPPLPAEYPSEATVDFFYECLGRAPRTKDGVAVERGGRRVRVVKPVETEEREARERRKKKGKGKARDQDRPEVEEDEDMRGEEGGVEDDLLHPPGLKATLMPFQSRAVRWLLAREGKIAVRLENPDVVMDEPASVDSDDDDEMEEAAAREERKHPIVLVDLPEDKRREIARGPLWEQVSLELPPEEEEEEGATQHFWLNRVASQLSLEDPADKNMGEDEDESDDGKEEDEKPFSTLTGSGQGLLSEEMGLGKTIEIISLILLHRAPERNKLPSYQNDEIDSTVKPTNLTLIIAPSAIVAQWQSEIKNHAPSLRVLRYENTKAIKETWTPSYIAKQFDIVLTTFDVLRREVVLARKPHERALRSGREGRHRYRRSLLVQIDWLRVVMDEAQMVGDTVSLTSETASLIPRQYSFAVTGTPLKARIEDLQGLLRFLKIEPIGSNRSYLTRLLEEVPTFVRVCEQLGARTVKAQVYHELFIPAQHRCVIPVNFTAIEQYYYDQRYLEALEVLGLESDGSPKDGGVDADGNIDWSLDKSEMNRWLVALRQLCCHPQVGQGNKRVLGSVLKTVDDVLFTMKDSAVAAVQSDQRALWLTRVSRAQLMTYDKEDCERFENALEIFLNAQAELAPLVQDLLTGIREAWADRKAERTRRGRSPSDGTAVSSDPGQTVGGALGLGLDDDEKIGDVPLSEKERAIGARLSALRNRLREVLLIQHSALFFAASTYFNMGKFPEEEKGAYADAEELRSTVLKPYETRVETAAVRLRSQMNARQKAIPLDLNDLGIPFSETGHGLVAQPVFEDIETTSDVMNGYAELIWQWREIILRIIYEPVSISGDDATGDEYAERAEQQEKLDCYLEAYGSLLSEWRCGLTGERSALDDNLDLEAYGYAEKKSKTQWAAADGSHRSRLKKDEKKKQALKLKDRAVPSIDGGDSPADVLRYELLVERSEAKGEGNAELEIVPLRNLIKSIKDASEVRRREEEEELLKEELKRLQAILKSKEKTLDRLKGEHNDISKAYNSRITYFAQLQAISDEVRDPDFFDQNWSGFPIEMGKLADQEEKLLVSIQKKSSQRRYLESLATDGTGEDENTCVICSSEYTQGVLTSCGHLTCQSCFNAWLHRSRTCALCKTALKTGDWQVVKYSNRRVGSDEEGANDSNGYEDVDPVTFEAPVRLSTIDEDELAEIQDVETAIPLSSKSDLMVKHVKLIRRNDPTAKIVIFSAWTDALEILMQAFARNGLGYVRLENSGKKENVVNQFISNPNIAAFFLHTKSQSAGLNLTCAQYVFLVEPLLHPSLELQAVGRVDRIGQSKETHVYQYYVSDTVDQRLAELRGRNKSSLFLNSGSVNVAKESRILTEDMARTGNSPGKKTSEETIQDEDDIARVLFSPDHFLNVQRALLPASLKGKKKAVPTPGMKAAEAAEVRREGAGSSGTGRR